MGRLPGWTRPPEALAATPFPDADGLRPHEEALRAATEALADAARCLEVLDEERRRVAAELGGLAAAGEVPSPAAVTSARDRRDRLWRVVRACYVEGREPAPADLATLEGASEIGGRFEDALRHADALVDRRESEAQRIARFSDLTAQELRLAGQRAAAEAALVEARAAEAAAGEAWAALWRSLGLAAEPPAAMRAWLVRKDAALQALAKRRESVGALADADAGIAAARALLERAARAVGEAHAPDLPVLDLDRAVRGGIAAASLAHATREKAARRDADARARLAEARLAHDLAQVALQGWAERWAQALPALGLAPDAGRPEADAALKIWSEIRSRLAARDTTLRRLEGLQRDNARLREELARLVAAIGSEAAGLDPAADPEGTIAALDARSGAAREAKARRAAAETARDAAATALAEQRRGVEAVEAAALAFRQAYRLAPEADVPAVAEAAVAHRRRLVALEDRRAALAGASDGLPEAALRAELSGTTPDTAAAELDLVRAGEERLVAQGQEAAQAETRAGHALDALAGRGGVAAQAQRARHHAQGVATHLERWMRLTAAKHLLERTLERYRAENQHPLVRRGGELFVRIAGTGDNPFTRLDVAYGDGAEPTLLGLRRDGTMCGVEGMSEGTRDQLYLALRMAALEGHAAGGEPMPFIADDLFVTSDEERVRAGLMTLAELGRNIQVILFTHHQHVLRLAATLSTGEVRLHALRGAPAAPATVEASAA